MIKGANKIALGYLLAGIGWILFSDHLFEGAPAYVQTLKGLSYVCLTALGLWLILRRNEKLNRTIMDDLIAGIDKIEKKDRDLQQERNLLRTLIDNLPDHIFVKDVAGKLIVANKALVKFVGKSDESAVLGRSAVDFFPQYISSIASNKDLQLASGKVDYSEHEFLFAEPSGKVRRMHSTKIPVVEPNGDILATVGISRDITTVYNKTRTDELVLNIINSLSASPDLQTALVASLGLIGKHFDFKFAEAWLATPKQDQVLIAATWSDDPKSTFHENHQRTYNSGEGLPGRALQTKEIQIWTDVMNNPGFTWRARNVNQNLRTGIGIPLVLQDNVIAVFTYLSEEEFFDFPHVKLVLLQVSAQIALHLERKKHEDELEKSNQQINNILESISDGFYALNDDWTFTYWNNAAERLLSKSRQDIVGFNIWEVYPGLIGSLLEASYREAMSEKVTVVFELFFEPLQVWFNITVFPSTNGISVYFKDITGYKNLTAELDERIEELGLSNAELEQFAYIASHDLQEPLRMVTGFLTQLDKKYADSLDDKARQYIHYAVDGAVRMRKIILDLLDYSRVGKAESQYTDVDITGLIDDIIVLNQVLIDDGQVTINVGKMPRVYAIRTLLQQVFQNLIVNAINYKRKEAKPVINISASDLDTYWQFAIEDNGIGIKSDFYDKIFVLFQRLHSREEYSGTGIGLAICKKIIESHGGRIWVDSVEGFGSTFYFTIKK